PSVCYHGLSLPAGMTLSFVREFFRSAARQSPLAQAAQAWSRAETVRLGGLTPAAQLLAAAQLQRLTQRPLVLVVEDNRAAEEAREMLATFVDLTAASEAASLEEQPVVLPSFEIDPYEGLSPHPAILEQRAHALWRIGEGIRFLVVPAVAAAAKLPPPGHSRGLVRRLRRGDVLDPEALAEQLVLVGYQRQEPVELPGQFAIRGGLLDVFSPEAPQPVRIELFGDEIESLREFDAASQRSVRPLEEVLLLPLTPMPLTAALRAELGDAPPPGWEFRAAALEGYQHSLWDQFERPLVLVAEPAVVGAQLEGWWQRLRERFAASPEAGPAPEALFFTPEEFQAQLLEQRAVEARELEIEELDLRSEAIELGIAPGLEEQGARARRIGLNSRPAPRYFGAMARMMEEVQVQLAQGQRLFFFGASAGEVERLGDLFTEYRVPFQFGWRAPRSGVDYLSEKAYFSTEAAAAVVVRGVLARGFSLPDQQLTLFSSNDLFQEDAAQRMAEPPRRVKVSTFLSDFRDLAPGDFVVHVEHGIGRYAGLKNFADGPEVEGKAAARAGEFMILEYTDAAKLYVPLTRMDLVQKYRSAEGA